MKKINLLLLACGIIMSTQAIYAQSAEVSQLLLNVEKLAQLKNILSQMKRSYSILWNGYGMVKELSQGNFNLHRTFIQGLMVASPAVQKYHRVSAIMKLQIGLVNSCSRAINKYKGSGRFSMEELNYLASVHQKVLKESLINLGQLSAVILDHQLQMNDGERLMAIDGVYERMEKMIWFVRDLHREAEWNSVQRNRQEMDRAQIERLYQLDNKN